MVPHAQLFPATEGRLEMRLSVFYENFNPEVQGVK